MLINRRLRPGECGKTYESVLVDIPEQDCAVAGGGTVEVDDQRVDAVMGRTQVSNVVANNELQHSRIYVSRRIVIICATFDKCTYSLK